MKNTTEPTPETVRAHVATMRREGVGVLRKSGGGVWLDFRRATVAGDEAHTAAGVAGVRGRHYADALHDEAAACL